MIINSTSKPLMVLGTSSGAGKSLMVTAICRVLSNQGERPIPFKGQNMSNNAWVDNNGGEMAYSQALQAWAARVDPICSMNPILLKPQGDCISEIIHLGESVGITKAKDYYQNWFNLGWEAIQKGLKILDSDFPNGRLIIEGAGSPVEVNLKHRDLTNLRIAKYLNANCLLIADIERGGVFAQLIGTLALLSPEERELVKGIIINRFRGDSSLFDSGREWIEKETNIPVLGVMPWLNEIFPPEDSLDLLERKPTKTFSEIEIAIIQLPSLSNFSDLDPLESEDSVKLKWVKPGNSLGNPDAVIIPGSKQTIKDLQKLNTSNLATEIKEFAKKGGEVFGICGGLQMLGETLEDPYYIENLKSDNAKNQYEGLKLLPIKTIFKKSKSLLKREVLALWPQKCIISGFELHHGFTQSIDSFSEELQPFSEDSLLGWVSNRDGTGIVSGTYLHGIFENGEWRRYWINQIRRKKGLKPLAIHHKNYIIERDELINRLSHSFQKHINLQRIL
ncbi:cobyric acid synthase [Prochlorococcus sp. MIT 0601]|uniref:cobyric acid synthase n=1 Tax=Prochlorococcus sp. MIT 0601 TaxID=1499498 RepID=UPI0005338940|nr:cobyric acid synthase [Prochlorococcus sp. MIT 0601]KGG12112.1 Cobyric acid synthase [Prochlorococcus sp. MIT 0601]